MPVKKRRQSVQHIDLTNYPALTDDEWLDRCRAEAFLTGQFKKSKFIRRERLRGEEERIAQQALVRVLRSGRPLPKSLRETLAELFDPKSIAIGRKLVLKFRRKGNPSANDLVKNGIVAAFVDYEISQQGNLSKTAVFNVAKLYGVSVKTIKQMRAAHKKSQKGTSIRK